MRASGDLNQKIMLRGGRRAIRFVNVNVRRASSFTTKSSTTTFAETNTQTDASSTLSEMFSAKRGGAESARTPLTRDDLERLGKLTCLDTQTMDDAFLESLNGVVEFCRLVEEFDVVTSGGVQLDDDDAIVDDNNRFRQDNQTDSTTHADFEQVRRMPSRFVDDYFVGPSSSSNTSSSSSRNR